MKKILIIVDMQKDFVDGSLGSPQARETVAGVRKKLDEYLRNGDDVIFTRDTHGENYLETQEGKNLPVPHCIENTEGWRIIDELNMENPKIWNKPTFGSPELAEHINKEYGGGEREIELVGLCTDICVVSNALLLKAFMPEAKITVDAGCCAGITEESHKAALLTMKMCQINVVNTEGSV